MATYINDEQPTHKKENVSKKINLDDDDGYFILVLGRCVSVSHFFFGSHHYYHIYQSFQSKNILV